MDGDQQTPAIDLNPNHRTAATESGELERPQFYRRRIDCGGSPEIAERRTLVRVGRRLEDETTR